MSILRFCIILLTFTAVACVPNYPPPQLYRLNESSTYEIKELAIYARTHAPEDEAFIAVQRIAEPFIKAKDWDKAVKVFEEYRPLFGVMDERFGEILRILEAPRESLLVTNLGPGINTKGDEGFPIPTADSRTIYFTASKRPDSWGGEDIFVSSLENGVWRQSSNLGPGINTENNESATSVSADGTRLFFFGHYTGSYGRGDIFYSLVTPEGWGAVEHFRRPVNTVYFESDGLLSSDGKALFFTSDRPGNAGCFHQKDEPFHGNTWGNTDIYVCVWQDTGWGEPVNLGPVINTPYAERTPFLHPDGKTLYFSSDGHTGLGRLDVFKSTRLSDTSWTQWSKPRNLGKELNTAGDDFGYKISTSGEAAYYAAFGENGGYGGYDVYSTSLPGQARPSAVATITGIVKNEQGSPIQAAIKWENLASGENAGELQSDPRDGSYFIALPLGINYGYYAEKQGYYPISKNIDLSNTVRPIEITEDIIMVSVKEVVEQGTPVRINNIFFDFDQYTLRPESYPELKRLADLLKSNPATKVVIAGHTDDVGSDSYNMKLSLKRAKAVVDYLVSIGCEKEGLVPKGYGKLKPVTTNQTDEGRAQNRRVEFMFVK